MVSRLQWVNLMHMRMYLRTLVAKKDWDQHVHLQLHRNEGTQLSHCLNLCSAKAVHAKFWFTQGLHLHCNLFIGQFIIQEVDPKCVESKQKCRDYVEK